MAFAEPHYHHEQPPILHTPQIFDDDSYLRTFLETIMQSDQKINFSEQISIFDKHLKELITHNENLNSNIDVYTPYDHFENTHFDITNFSSPQSSYLDLYSRRSNSPTFDSSSSNSTHSLDDESSYLNLINNTSNSRINNNIHYPPIDQSIIDKYLPFPPYNIDNTIEQNEHQIAVQNRRHLNFITPHTSNFFFSTANLNNQMLSTLPPDNFLPLHGSLKNRKLKTKKEKKINSIQSRTHMDGDFLTIPANASNFLIEFRKNHREFSLYELRNNLLEFAFDQLGSSYLQNRFETSMIDEQEFLIKCLKMHIVQLSIHPQGTHLIQKILEIGTELHKQVICEQLLSSVLRLSCHEFGCRVIQKAIETLPLKGQILIANGLMNDVIKCVEDQNGNHVIQKFIEQMPPSAISFIIVALENKFLTMATHCYGCRVVQRLIRFCPPEQVKIFYQEIIRYLLKLSKDKYGNYVVQLALRYGTPTYKDEIIKIICKNILDFSTQKYACNVVEIALQHSNDQNVEAIIWSALTTGSDGKTAIVKTMNHEFGNYVVQRLLESSQGQQREILISILKTNIAKLESSIFGKHILNALNRLKAEHTY